MKRRTFLASGVSLAAATTLAAPAIARGKVEWKIISAFPRDAPGVGTNVVRYAELVSQMSDGRLTLTVYGAGELAPAFSVEDAVQRGDAEVGHTSPYYAADRNPALHWYTGVPFGMTSNEHAAWLRWGGGQEIWDSLYAQRNLKPFYSGNSNTQSGGWFRKRIESVDDLNGIKMRIAGLGGETLQKLGVTPVLLPPAEILPALESGRIDAAEWVSPMLDEAFGLQKVMKFCYLPAYTEPSAAVAVVFNSDAWAGLAPDLQAICAAAASASALEMESQFDYDNARAFQSLSAQGTEFLNFPDEVIAAMRSAWQQVHGELAQENTDVARILESYDPYLERARSYSRAMTEPLLANRD